MIQSLKKTYKSNQKYIFWLILIIQLPIMLIMSQDVGISADEFRHYRHAEKVYKFYRSKGEDKSALESTGRDPMQFNGQSFDNLMYLVEKVFSIDKYMELRHFFNALIGWLIILITALVVKEFWGYEGAIIAVLLLFISPRFLGHALNNNKDIPFAFGFTLGIYGIILFLKKLPKISYKAITFLFLGIAVAISVRFAGILLIAFLGFYSMLYYITKKPIFSPFEKEKRKVLIKLLLWIPIISLVGYLLGILFWPYMISDPINGFKVVMDATSTHPISLNQLFDGKIYQSNNLPNEYVVTYILYTYPLFVLLSITMFLILLPFYTKKKGLFYHIIFLFSFCFVVFWMSFKNSNVYGGIRHLLFIYPIAIYMAVSGFMFLLRALEKFQNKWIKLIPFLFLLLLSLNPAAHIISNYPYSYVYFNEIIGGVNNASEKYETDYFQHSLKHATEWFINNELKEKEIGDSSKIKVITNDYSNTDYYLKSDSNNINLEYSRYYEKCRKDWDYAIFYCAYIEPTQLENELWPPKGAIHIEEVDGFPIAAVVKRISHEDYKGFQALDARKTEEAKEHFKAFLKLYPESEEALEGMARAFMMRRNFDSTLVYADSSLRYNPRQLGSWLLKASAHNSKKEYREALEASNKMVDISQSFAEGHFQKGIALRNLGNANEALKEFQIAINLKNDYYAAHMQMGDILLNYRKYNDAEKIYKKVLGFRENDFTATVRLAKCYHLAGNPQQAQQALQYAEKRSSNHFEVVKLKSRMELAQGDLNEAGQFLSRCRNINSNSDLEVIRAKYSLAINREEQAQNFLEKALELNKNNIEAKNLLRQVENNQKQEAKEEEPQQSIMFQKEKKQEGPKINLLNNSR